MQKHELGEVGKHTIFRLPVVYEIFLPKIIKIQQRLLELQRKMLGVFFSRHSVYTIVNSRNLLNTSHSMHQLYVSYRVEKLPLAQKDALHHI